MLDRTVLKVSHSQNLLNLVLTGVFLLLTMADRSTRP